MNQSYSYLSVILTDMLCNLFRDITNMDLSNNYIKWQKNYYVICTQNNT